MEQSEPYKTVHLDQSAIENMIDTYDISHVFRCIAQICYEKAEHIRVTWQDENLATHWEQTGTSLEHFMGTTELP